MDWEAILWSAQRTGAAWSKAHTHTHYLSCVEHAWLWELRVWLWIWDWGLCECQGVGGSTGCVGVYTEQSLSCSALPFCCGSQSQCRLSILGSTLLAVSWRHCSDVDHETEPLGCCALWNTGCQLAGYGRSASLQGPNVDSSLARDSIFLTPEANCQGTVPGCLAVWELAPRRPARHQLRTGTDMEREMKVAWCFRKECHMAFLDLCFSFLKPTRRSISVWTARSTPDRISQYTGPFVFKRRSTEYGPLSMRCRDTLFQRYMTSWGTLYAAVVCGSERCLLNQLHHGVNSYHTSKADKGFCCCFLTSLA